MSCKKTNCCRKVTAVESEITMKTTAELNESIGQDLKEDDKSLSELLKENEDDDDNRQKECDLSG